MYRVCQRSVLICSHFPVHVWQYNVHPVGTVHDAMLQYDHTQKRSLLFCLLAMNESGLMEEPYLYANKLWLVTKRLALVKERIRLTTTCRNAHVNLHPPYTCAQNVIAFSCPRRFLQRSLPNQVITRALAGFDSISHPSLPTHAKIESN